ncbi:hypothetical protein NEMBOFW57_000325 [Staphylotrichum longicolle]|uniref:DUF6594 domain-containing protein n=1 Tax=Staphylotrichum longicolle TaxID=669026 RepID=A0AAD4I1J3_9PEZI|nr:hypothetical protein NEMBOFW57_000325 [Staphylotrichum longicolle]
MAGEENWTIFRRFDEFNLLNLLILQGEIQNLTSVFKKLCSQATDNAEGDPRAWYMLLQPLAGRNPPVALDQAHEKLEARRREATTAAMSNTPRVLALGKKRPHMSKAEMAKKHAFASRFIMALFGGVALILPTVIMSKLQGINVSLITTSIAVFLFGLALAFGATDSTGKDVLTATAAYTAVLVVFIGTSLDSGDASADSGALGNTTTVV